jgi:hypothetical protein
MLRRVQEIHEILKYKKGAKGHNPELESEYALLTRKLWNNKEWVKWNNDGGCNCYACTGDGGNRKKIEKLLDKEAREDYIEEV